MAALLAPFGNCVDVLNPAVFQPLLVDGLKMTFNYAKNLDNCDFKDKVCTAEFGLLNYVELCISNLYCIRHSWMLHRVVSYKFHFELISIFC